MLRNDYIKILIISVVIWFGIFCNIKSHSAEIDCPSEIQQIKAGLQNIDEGLGANSKGTVVNINDNTSVKPPTEEKEQAKSKAEIETQKETTEKDLEKLRARYEEQERMRRQEESDRRARDIARTYGSGEKREGGLRDYLDKLGRTTDEMKSKDKQVATLIISPKEIELNVGESKSFSATAASADGTTRNVTGEASWSGGTGNSFKATKGWSIHDKRHLSWDEWICHDHREKDCAETLRNTKTEDGQYRRTSEFYIHSRIRGWKQRYRQGPMESKQSFCWNGSKNIYDYSPLRKFFRFGDCDCQANCLSEVGRRGSFHRNMEINDPTQVSLISRSFGGFQGDFLECNHSHREIGKFLFLHWTPRVYH